MAVEQQMALQNALEKDDRQEFLKLIRDYSINNIIIGTSQNPTIVSGYVSLLTKAIEKWILGIKEETNE